MIIVTMTFKGAFQVFYIIIIMTLKVQSEYFLESPHCAMNCLH